MSQLSQAWDRVVAKAAGMSQMDAFPLWTTGDRWVTAAVSEPDRGIMPHDGSWMVGDLPAILWFAAAREAGRPQHDQRRGTALRWSEKLENRAELTTFASVSHMFFRGALVPLLCHDAVELQPLVLRAAATISSRFRTIGYMKSFGPPGDAEHPFTTIDDVINLCIPLWYAQRIGDDDLAAAALDATAVIGRHLVRDDGSTIQVLLFDPDGSPNGVDTYQGHSSAGCWSRGLAWGIYGFAVMASISGNPEHRHLAQNMADYWIDHVQDDPSPIWDLELPSAGNPVRDSFAASLAYAGLLELAAISGGSYADKVRDYTVAQMTELSRKYVVGHGGIGILRGAALDVPHEHGVGDDAAVIVGDSYYVEALWRLLSGKADRPLLTLGQQPEPAYEGSTT